MKKIKRKPKAKKNKFLAEQVEMTSYNSQVDREDSDLLSYVDEFMKDYLSMPPLEAGSLLTPESALRALEAIEEAQVRVDGHRKTALALKKLLESK